jgi:plasmid stabilization system protein ParE
VNVIWTQASEQDRYAIWDYITIDNPQAAARINKLFSEAATRLITLPNIGRTVPFLRVVWSQVFPKGGAPYYWILLYRILTTGPVPACDKNINKIKRLRCFFQNKW